MDRIRPFWRFVISFVWLFVFVYQTNMMTMGEMGYFQWSLATAAFVTWIYLCFKVKYVDPLRVLMEIEMQRREEELERNNDKKPG